jgi:hypothetical protein
MAGCIVAVAVTMLTAGSALGYFTTTGAGLASASVSSLSKPEFKSVSAGSGGTVTLNWGAVTAPGAGTVLYYVTRDGEKVAGTCPNAGSPSAGTVCIDKEVPLGTHSYVVTAVWSTWSAASAPVSATVTAGPAAGLVLTASSTTPTAGTGVNLTITAQDTYGNTATTYTGSKSLTFSGALASPGGNAPTVTNASGTAIAFGTATPITFTSGVASISGTKNGVMTLYKSAAANISVTDGTISTASPLAVTVSNATPSKLVLAAETATPAVGAADPLTITAFDTYGNTATTYTGSKSLTFSGALASPGGNAPTVTNASGTAIAFGTATPITFTSGVASISGTKNGVMTLYKSAAANISVTDGTLTSAAVTVTPLIGAASKLAFTHPVASAGALSTPCYFTCTATLLGNSGTIKAGVAVTDTYGNVVSALGSGHSVAVTTTGGTLTGGTITIPATGAAESTTEFTYTSKSSGSFTDTVKAATSAGTVYTNATITASK